MPSATAGREVFRFHVPAIPHTVTSKDYLSCAFTQKVLKLCDMLTKLGHEVYHYGCEGTSLNCTEDVSVVSNDLRLEFYPDDPNRSQQFRFDCGDAYHKLFHHRVAREVEKRLGDRDFLLCAWGHGHKPIADALAGRVLTVESGIGYLATFAAHRVFESYAWMHWLYGKENRNDGALYDAVIPNYFDPGDFTYQPDKDDWFLYLGRIVKRKGVELAVEMTKRLGTKLVIAGQGELGNRSEGLDLRADHVQFVGYADVEKRRYLMASAKALICPTYYIEPFGGVAVEAMLSGTPVITTDFGAFSETVLHGVTGYRCHTLEQFVWAGRNVGELSPAACREWALTNYSCDRVSRMYQEYFSMLYGLWGEGWPARNDDRTELEWLRRVYPSVAPVVAGEV